jgi:plastocyanin
MHRTRRPGRVGVAAIAAAVALSAAAFAAAIAGPAHAAEVVQVRMKALVYTPTTISAHVGDTIEWINDDFVAHTATARNGDWDINIPPNATRRVVLGHAGTVAFYCRFHPNMKGEVAVTPP